MPLYKGFLSKTARDNIFQHSRWRLTNQNRAEKCCHNNPEVLILQEKDREAETFSFIDNWDVICNYNGINRQGKKRTQE